MTLRFVIFSGIWLLLALFAWGFFIGAGTIHQASGLGMGTSWSAQWVIPPWQTSATRTQIPRQGGIPLVSPPLSRPRPPVAAEIETLLARLDREIFSTWAEDSELSRLNRQPPGVPMPVSAELFAVLRLAGEISTATGGAFDATAGSLVNLWGFGPRGAAEPAARIPTDAEINQTLINTGINRLELDEASSTATRLAEVYIDLGAIAKGYAVDQVVALLRNRGYESYFVEIGGELGIGGRKPGFRVWRAALEAPDAEASIPWGVISNRNEHIAVAGSGSYRNFFILGGASYPHQIDPRSGRPVQHELAAVYVISDSAANADALATALMVMGFAEARRFVESRRLAALLLKADASVSSGHYASSSFYSYLQQISPDAGRP